MARPWDAAEPESLWEITGAYPNSEDTFAQCLAITLPQHVTGTEKPLFVFVGALSLEGKPVDPSWITYARPLLLVHRDEPAEPYWEQDRIYLRGAS